MMDSRHQIRVLGRGAGDAVEMVTAHRKGDLPAFEEAARRLMARLETPRGGNWPRETASLRRSLSACLAGNGAREPDGLTALAARLCRHFAMEDLQRASRAFESAQYQLAALLLEVASDEALQALELEEGRLGDPKTGVLIHEVRTVAAGYLAHSRALEALRPTIDTLRLVLESMKPPAASASQE